MVFDGNIAGGVSAATGGGIIDVGFGVVWQAGLLKVRTSAVEAAVGPAQLPSGGVSGRASTQVVYRLVIV